MPDKKLKILHIHDVAFVASTLVSGLNEIGADAEFYELLNWKNIKTPRLVRPVLTAIARFVEIFRLSRFLRKQKFDIVHIHYGSFAYLALLNHIPFYLHIHGTDVRRHIHWPILGYVIRQGIKKARRVFYTTPDLQPLVEAVRPDAIFFPNPVDVEKFTPKLHVNKTHACDIFNINKLDRYKGIDQVLKSIELLWEQAPDARVAMFGFGNALNLAEPFLSKYQNDPRLNLVPRVPHERMVELIQDTAMVMGQIGTGILTCSELEAMACEKPVICNFKFAKMYSSLPPVLIANSPEEARNHMIFLLNHPEEGLKIGEEARKWVVDNFDKRVVAKKLLKIYLEAFT